MNGKRISRQTDAVCVDLLDQNVLEVFCGERPGTAAETHRLHQITELMKDRIFIEAVFLLTHVHLEDKAEAHKIFNDIIHHRNSLVKALRRNVSIQVATLDYMQIVRNILTKPTIIEADQYDELAYNAILDETSNAYDKHLADDCIEAEVDKAKRHHHQFSILLLAFDNLNEMNHARENDTESDAVRFVGGCAKQNLRKYDTIHWYGGTEFVVILSDADADRSYTIAQRVLRLTQASMHEKLSVKLMVNIGMATFDNYHIKDRISLLAAAADAMKTAAKKGREEIHISGGASIDRGFKNESGKDAQYIRKILKGIPLAPGTNQGKLFRYHDILTREFPTKYLRNDEIPAEMVRIESAIENVQRDLLEVRRSVEKTIGPHYAAIFDVHHAILEDICLRQRIESELREKKIDAEHIIYGVFCQFEKEFRLSDSLILKDRIYDLQDIARRLLHDLCGNEENVLEEIPNEAVIYTKRFLPSDTVYFIKKKPHAIITQEGGSASHASMLARALGIPLVALPEVSFEEIPTGIEVIIDAAIGSIIINPDENDKKAFQEKIESVDPAVPARLTNELHREQERVKVFANATTAADVLGVPKYGGDGIGLFRTETFYLLSPTMPSEEDIFHALDDSLNPVQDKEIILRLPDLGGDKILPYLNIGREHSSALGLRGIRVLLLFPEFLKSQIRIFLRLSAKYDIRILVPLITMPEDMQRTRSYFDQIKKDLVSAHIPFNPQTPLGAMLETPAAALRAEEILHYSDFVSIGTNDMIQYLTAADRNILHVEHYYKYGSKLVFELIKKIVDTANAVGKDCIVCGDMAGDSKCTRKLFDVGIRNFSVAPQFIADIKNELVSIFKDTMEISSLRNRC